MKKIYAKHARAPSLAYDFSKKAPTLLQALQEAGQDAVEFLSRHQHGDWGELGEEDKKENDFSVLNHFRILSAYTLTTGVKIWIITEADRSATTILLPEDY